jgi:hypothetical protein
MLTAALLQEATAPLFNQDPATKLDIHDSHAAA